MGLCQRQERAHYRPGLAQLVVPGHSRTPAGGYGPTNRSPLQSLASFLACSGLQYEPRHPLYAQEMQIAALSSQVAPRKLRGNMMADINISLLSPRSVRTDWFIDDATADAPKLQRSGTTAEHQHPAGRKTISVLPMPPPWGLRLFGTWRAIHMARLWRLAGAETPRVPARWDTVSPCHPAILTPTVRRRHRTVTHILQAHGSHGFRRGCRVSFRPKAWLIPAQWQSPGFTVPYLVGCRPAACFIARAAIAHRLTTGRHSAFSFVTVGPYCEISRKPGVPSDSQKGSVRSRQPAIFVVSKVR